MAETSPIAGALTAANLAELHEQEMQNEEKLAWTSKDFSVLFSKSDIQSLVGLKPFSVEALEDDRYSPSTNQTSVTLINRNVSTTYKSDPNQARIDLEAAYQAETGKNISLPKEISEEAIAHAALQISQKTSTAQEACRKLLLSFLEGKIPAEDRTEGFFAQLDDDQLIQYSQSFPSSSFIPSNVSDASEQKASSSEAPSGVEVSIPHRSEKNEPLTEEEQGLLREVFLRTRWIEESQIDTFMENIQPEMARMLILRSQYKTLRTVEQIRVLQVLDTWPVGLTGYQSEKAYENAKAFLQRELIEKLGADEQPWIKSVLQAIDPQAVESLITRLQMQEHPLSADQIRNTYLWQMGLNKPEYARAYLQSVYQAQTGKPQPLPTELSDREALSFAKSVFLKGEDAIERAYECEECRQAFRYYLKKELEEKEYKAESAAVDSLSNDQIFAYVQELVDPAHSIKDIASRIWDAVELPVLLPAL